MRNRIRSLEDFLALLNGVKRVSNGSYMALCPGHSDHNPSLSIKEVDHRILINCFAKCERAGILEALGLESEDLLLDKHEEELEHREREREGTVKPIPY